MSAENTLLFPSMAYNRRESIIIYYIIIIIVSCPIAVLVRDNRPRAIWSLRNVYLL